MEQNSRRKSALLAAGWMLLSLSLSAQSHISTQSHQSAVTAVVPANSGDTQKTFFSAGQDGFLIKWSDDDQGEHYQISDLPIKFAAVCPGQNLIAVYETDSGRINRVSVWDFTTLTRKYARQFSDSVTSLTFSAGGTFLIVGTATVNGAVFLRSSDGTVADKISDATGMFSYASTSSTEKTFFTYSPAGTISYYNLQTGKVKGKFSAEPGLSQVTTFSSDLFLAGVKNNTLYVLSALSGNTIGSYPSYKPVILADKTDKNLYFLENSGRNGYALKTLVSTDSKSISAPQTVRTFRPLTGDVITSGAKEGTYVMLGSQSGALFRTDCAPETTLLSFYPLTQNVYDKIYDMAPAGEDFYFLTQSALYKSSYDSGIVNRIADNPGQTQVTAYGDSLVIWSRGTRNPVQLLDPLTKNITVLFTPKSTVQTVRVFGNILLELESNSYVNAYHLDTQLFEELYSGSALQDAVISGGILYIAKSSATNPASPLLSVDLATKETVPINTDGNVIYSLCAADTYIYGIAVQSDENSKKTVLFSFDPQSRQTTPLLSLADEDTNAIAALYGNEIYTNIGRDNVFSYNLSDRTTITYARSASLPVKVSRNTNRLVILNRDGSVSWHTVDVPQVLADWYLTKDGNWYEF